MIIRSLRAEGFMRHELLELTELPRGVTAITGDNEAGKTSIGEAISFALFGRTIRTEGGDPTLAIHWEKDVLRTRIEFEVGRRSAALEGAERGSDATDPGKAALTKDDGETRPAVAVYRVERLVARTGELEARLVGPDEHVLAEGLRPVAERLQALLGLDFSVFRYSFYIAQHELDLIQRDSRDNARRIVRDMLGITTVERARADLEVTAREKRERLSTLERDLVVARALHTEALPVERELAEHEDRLVRARTRHSLAVTQEERARVRSDLAAKALAAARERDDAVARIETSLLAQSERQALLRSLRRLEALTEQATTAVQKAQGEAQTRELPRRAAREAFDEAQAIDRAARALEDFVSARRDQLAREVAAETGPDSLPARLAREASAAEAERRTARTRGILGAVALVAAFLLVGTAAGTRFPPDGPLATFPERLIESPTLGLTIGLNPPRLGYVLGALGCVVVLAGVWALLGRARALSRATAVEVERDRLQALDQAEHQELVACQAFKLGGLDQVEPALALVTEKNARDALEHLKRVAGAHMASGKSPPELLAEARARAEKAEGRDAELNLAEARRVEAVARHALEETRATAGAAFPEGVPAGTIAWQDPPVGLDALAEAVQAAAGGAVRARIELDALEHGRRSPPVAEAVAALKAALGRAFEAHNPVATPDKAPAAAPARGDAATVRGRWADQTGLPTLLEPRAEGPSKEDLRAVVRRERDLLRELLGDEASLREELTAADTTGRRAREELVQAQAELDEARARGERLEAGRRRLDELTRKTRSLEEVLVPARRELALHGAALTLLDDLARSLEARFSPAIARYVEAVLPRLTGNRYRRVRVDPDLDIHVFSPERRDFVRLVELSVGTADQVLLAIRLGLARALVRTRGLGGSHFLFLDEPLVSADETRGNAFLALLRVLDEVSPEPGESVFGQVFITSTRRLEDAALARRIDLRNSTPSAIEAPA